MFVFPVSPSPSPASSVSPSSILLSNFLPPFCPLSSTSSVTHMRFIRVNWRIREHHFPVTYQVSSLLFTVNNSSYSKSISPAFDFLSIRILFISYILFSLFSIPFHWASHNTLHRRIYSSFHCNHSHPHYPTHYRLPIYFLYHIPTI